MNRNPPLVASRTVAATAREIAETWEVFFTLRDLGTRLAPRRHGGPSEALHAIAGYLGQGDRIGLKSYLSRLTAATLSVIEVDIPADGQVVGRPVVAVKGRTIPGSRIELCCCGARQSAQSAPQGGLFEFERVALVPGENSIDLRLASPWGSEGTLDLGGPRTPSPVLSLVSCSLSVELRAPFANQRNPVTSKPFHSAGFDQVVRCANCGTYTERRDWHGQCPMVETGHCTNGTLGCLGWEDPGFHDETQPATVKVETPWAR